MKKCFALVLSLFFLGLPFMAIAENYPGDTVTVKVSVSHNYDVAGFQFALSFDTSALEFVNASGQNGVTAPGSSTGSFLYEGGSDGMTVLTASDIGSVTFRIKDGAEAGTYSISALNKYAYTSSFSPATLNVIIEEIVVNQKQCTTHTPGTAFRENEIPATCKEAGSYDEVVYCSICGTEISRVSKTIDKLTTHTPGTPVRENEIPATCKEAGSYDEVVYCAVCGTEISRTQKPIDKLTTHTPGTAVRENEVPATCKEAGSYDEVVYCSVCGTEISRVSKTIDKLTTHTPGTPVRENEIPATCKEAGSYDEVVYCAVCGTEISRVSKTIDKLTTHTPGTPVRENEVPATCKEAGSYDEVVYCAVCGTEISRTAKTIDKLTTHVDENTDGYCDECGVNLCNPHTPGTPVRENEVPATCKEAGSYDEVVYCSVCGTEISRVSKIIDKLTTHTPGTPVRENEIPATCKEAGSYDEVVYCAVCGTEISRVSKTIDKLTTHTPGTPVRENEVPATCKEAGSYDEVVYCAVCGTEISRTAKTIDKLTTHVDENTDGYCDECGVNLCNPHTPGTPVRENEVPATCKEAGSYDEVVYCSVCGTEISRVSKTIDKLTTHTPGTAVRENEIPATCKEAGSYDEVVYCSVCGTEISRVSKTIDKLTTHTDENNDDTCDVCGADLRESISYTVTVIGGDGSGQFVEGEVVSIQADTSDTERTFIKWDGIAGLKLTLGNQSTPYLSFEMPGHDITITAVFEEMTAPVYVVSFNSNGGTGIMAPITDVSGEYVLPECGFTAPTGKKFAGWSLTPDGPKITSPYHVSTNITLYAQWIAVNLPQITVPIGNETIEVLEGAHMDLSVTASQALSYQWYADHNDGNGFVKIPDATKANYRLNNVKLDSNGTRYYCLVSNNEGSIQSPVFTLKVLKAAEIPETGDYSNISNWVLAMVISILGMMRLYHKTRKSIG